MIPRSIAIVGAGFSGTATAIHLLRSARTVPLRITLIERGPEFGRGVAYARTHYPYLLNVPASRMSATASDPEAFLRFARRLDPLVTGEDFLPRALYGDYLQELLEVETAAASKWAQVTRLQGEVVDLAPGEEGTTTLFLGDHERVVVEAVVLALGAPGPRLPATISCTAAWPVIRKTPWSQGRPLGPGKRLLVIGTSLTMIDVVTAALHRQPQVEIHAISRHGLVPPSQTAFRPDALRGDGGLLAATGGSVTRLVAAARRLAREAERRGGDWREVVTLLRRQAPGLWAGLTARERGRFLRHVRAYWDIHRHRAPAAVLAVLEEARERGRLFVYAGRLQSLEPTADGARALWSERVSGQHHSLEVGEVVDCSGPDYDIGRSTEPLWRSLLARGLAVADDLRLGVRTDRNGALVQPDGAVSGRLFYVGPMLRADHWEATAVGELRTHAEQLAAHLLGTVYQ